MGSKTKSLLGNLTREREAEPEKLIDPIQDTTTTTFESPLEPLKSKTVSRKVDNGKDYKVHSFCIDWNDFDYLNDFVAHMRMSGNTKFTQKDALGAAIGLLKKKYPLKDLLKGN